MAANTKMMHEGIFFSDAHIYNFKAWIGILHHKKFLKMR